jgi:hypothetical protein
MKKKIICVALCVIAFIALMLATKPLTTAGSETLIPETTIAEIVEETTAGKELSLGDVNGDGYVNAIDASYVLSAYAAYSTDKNILTDAQKKAADINEDGSINSVDASAILSYYCYISTTTDEEPLCVKSHYINAHPKVSAITKEKIYFKPNTHYIHKASCHWCNANLEANEQLIEIETTEGIECRKCTECNPEIEIITPYVEPTPVAAGIDDYSRQLLAEIAWHEAGSNWISQYNKAKVVAGVMNRVNDPRFPNTVYSVLVAPNQFTGYWPGCCTPSQACYDAVDYYFAHTNEFNSDNSWWGDGYQNHFYYQ